MNYDKIQILVEDISDEVAVIKTVVENVTSSGEPFAPMLVFYSAPNVKEFVVAPQWGTTFEAKMRSIADTLQLFKATNSQSVIISFCTKAEYDSTMYQLLNIYVVSYDHAFAITLPYSVNDNNNVIWNDQHSACSALDELETDDMGRDVFSMFYHYVHLDETILTAREIFTYLSARGAAIVQFNSKYQYFELSEMDR
jgi:hypothetical protein